MHDYGGKKNPHPSRLRGRGADVSKTLFYYYFTPLYGVYTEFGAPSNLFFNQSTGMVSWPTFLAYASFSLRSSSSFSLIFSFRESSNTTEALSRNSFFQFRKRFGCMLFSIAIELRSFSPLSSLRTRSDLNFAVKCLLFRDINEPSFKCYLQYIRFIINVLSKCLNL